MEKEMEKALQATEAIINQYTDGLIDVKDAFNKVAWAVAEVLKLQGWDI